MFALPGDQEGEGGAEAGALLPGERHRAALGQEGLHRATGQVQERHQGVHAAPQGGENCLQGIQTCLIRGWQNPN